MRELIARIRQSARERHIPVMEDAPSELLEEVVARRQPQRILEIGTAIGYSGLLMLGSSPQATLTTIENDIDRMSEARKNFEQGGVLQRVRCILDDANFVVSVMEGKYDFILLDGPKGHYRTMYAHLLRLLTSDGMIFVDDILYQGLVEGDDYPSHKHRTIITNMRAFIQEVQNDSKVDCLLVNKGDGVMLIELKKGE